MNRLQEIIIGSKERSKEIGKLEKLGLLRKIAPRVYTSSLEEPPEKIIRRNWYRLVSDLFPDAFLSHRSALERMPTPEGHLYLTRSYKGLVELPGLMLHFSKGPDPLEDDILFFGNLKASGLSRAYLENLQRSKRVGGESKTLNREQLEEKIEGFLRVKGEQALNEVRDRAKAIAPALGMEKELADLKQLITDLLGTGLSKRLISPIARARVLGEPVDPDRIQLFESVYEELTKKEYPDYPDPNKTIGSYQNFAFFESYFSNYIEGTEFTVNEARQIITTSTPLPSRDEDSHDVLGTYQIVSNRKAMSIVPATPDDLLRLLKERHAILLHARKTKNPGEFKDKNNRAGSTEFVDKELVPGTLKKGFDWYSLIQHPFAKAAYMMFMISEVHPFLDGNGRMARVMMNAELSVKGMAKIIIPTVYREDYMGALKKLTKQRDADAYIRMLQRAWEFSSNIYNEDLDAMEKYLVSRNAFLTHKEGYLKITEAR
ncbi:Fic family protein [Flavihumibacter sp. UBA7668]|uniref:Fic family protein n=1 Tax=Flavihumibacter sp. UBA7668 TaxID=1946542 RepID=UPI0025C2B007|nr:Fic family protein [Flavihumibacter sp. UBA7668]